MAIIFDGKDFAREKEIKLKEATKRLREKGVGPKLVSIIVGNDPASVLYVNLKKRAAERVGAKVDILRFPNSVRVDELIHRTKDFNRDPSTHGIMVQLPLPKNFSKEDRDEIINTIAKEKDVDGLRDDSSYLTPTVKSVLEVIKDTTLYIVRPPLKERPFKVVIVGAKGFEGKRIFKVLKDMGYCVTGLDRKSENFREVTKAADILISVTGSPGIIGKDHIKEGAAVIDVGSPKGDVRTEEVMDKATFISPVPGGLGPVTISCLLENLVEASWSLS